MSPRPTVTSASVDGRTDPPGTGAGGGPMGAETLTGRDPLACQDAARFGSLAEERATPHPDRRANAYPHAFEHLAQVFDHPSAPDLVVLHTAAHYWGDQGGHLGEHGSLGVVQARAPFIAAGAGVAPARDRRRDRAGWWTWLPPSSLCSGVPRRRTATGGLDSSIRTGRSRRPR